MALWTAKTKTSMSVTEIDAEFMDSTSILFMDGLNMVFREARDNVWSGRTTNPTTLTGRTKS